MRGAPLIAVLLILLVFAVYIRSLGHEFIIWDDDHNIYKNEFLSRSDLSGVPRFWRGAFEGLYIPLTYTVWALLARVSGTAINPEAHTSAVVDPALFHLANIVIHAGSTLLVFTVIHRLTGRRDAVAAGLGACFFAVHPYQVEPVAWATGLKDVLGAFLALVSVWLYLNHSERVREGARIPGSALAFYLFSLLVFIGSLLAKPSLVVIPAMLALIDFLILGSDWKKDLAPPRPILIQVLGLSVVPVAAVILAIMLAWGYPPLRDAEIGAAGVMGMVTAVAGLCLAALVFSQVASRGSPSKAGASRSRIFWTGVLGLAATTALFWMLGRGAGGGPVRAGVLVSILGIVIIAAQGKTVIRSPLARLFPFFGASAVFVGITIATQTGEHMLFPLDPVPVWQRPFVALDAIGFYLSKLVYPFHHVPEYGRDPAWALKFARGFPLWILPLAGGWLLWRVKGDTRRPYFLAAGLALLGVAPVLGLVPFGFQGQSTVADRYMYLSMWGVGFGVTAWIASAEHVYPRRLAGICVLVLAAAAFTQAGRWEKSTTLFRHNLKINPRSAASAYDYGLACSNAGRHEEAVEFYKKAIELKPNFSLAYNNLGYLCNEHRRHIRALGYLEKAVELDPKSDVAYNNLGISLNALGRHEEAIAAYRKSLDLKPDVPLVFVNLASALAFAGEENEALKFYARSSALEPHNWRPLFGLGSIYLKQGRFPEAVNALERCIALKPGILDGHRQLAKAYAGMGQSDRAIRAATRAVEIGRATPGLASETLRLLEEERLGYLQGAAVESPR